VILAVRRTLDAAALQVHFPRVQRTHDRAAGDDAVAQRPALVRALVVDGKEPIAEVEQRQVAIADKHGATFAQRDVGGLRDTDPVVRHAIVSRRT
jgi:hypothetical protein